MNFLLINADQLRHDCLGYRHMMPVKTPNLDALAAESVVYTNAFTPLPVCAPARQSLLCGRNPDSFGAMWNYDVIPTATVQPEWCWPGQFRQLGMNTAYLGRFHVSPVLKPSDFGYDEWVSWAGHKQLIKEKYPDISYENGWFGCESPVPAEDSGTHWMADRASEMIRNMTAAGKPWHIWVDYEEPHLPCRPSKPFSEMYRAEELSPWPGFYDTFEGKPYCHRQHTVSWDTADKDWEHDFGPMVARYLGVVSQLDDAIGRILNTLRASGQWDDTMIVFTSDHGDMCGDHHMLDKHYTLYDDICRVPLLVKLPGTAPATVDSFVYNCLDVPHTLREVFGLAPDSMGHGMTLPVKNGDPAREKLVCTSNGQQMGLYTTRMLREKRYKYVWNLTDTDELYDTDTDPGELHNLIRLPEHKERISRMRKDLYAFLTHQNDPLVGNEWLRRQLLENKKI